MKKILSLTLFVAFLSAGTVAAQTGTQYARFGGGVSIQNEPDIFTDYWRTGWMANLNYGFPIWFEFSGELDASFQHFSFDDEKFLSDQGLDPDDVVIEGLTVQIYTIFLNAVFQPQFEGPVIPYIKGGVGLFVLREDDATLAGFDGSEVELFGDDLIEYGFGFQLQVGVDYFFNPRAAVFAQAGLSQGWPGGDAVRVFPVTAGLRLNVF